MPSVHEILLQVTGDTDDAAKDMAKLAGELTAFGRIDAEAEANINTREAEANLADLERKLETLSQTRATPEVKLEAARLQEEIARIKGALRELSDEQARPGVELVSKELDRQIKIVEGQMKRLDGLAANPNVNLDTAKFEAEYFAVRAQLEALKKERADITVGIDRTLSSRIASVAREAENLGDSITGSQKSLSTFFSTLGNSGVSFGPFTTTMSAAIPLVLALSAAVASVVAVVGALAASLGAAVAGLGALAVAFGGFLVPAIGLGVAAFARFQDQSKQAGTAAYALAQAFKDIQSAVKPLLAAADPVLRGLASGLKGISGVIKTIAPAFKEFGKLAGGAIKQLSAALTSPAMAKGLADLIRLAGPILKPAAAALGSLAELFLKIARAAMPALQRAIEGIAGGLQTIVNKIGGVKSLGGVIDGLVDHLSSWVDMMGALGSVFVEFSKIAAPFGKEIVDAITEGATQMANWIKSAEGNEQITQFFEDVLPLAAQLAEFIGKLALVFLQLGQFMAPAFTEMVGQLNDFLDVLSDVLTFLNNNVSPGVRAFVGTVVGLLLAFTKISKASIAIRLLWSVLIGILSAVVSIAKTAASIIGTVLTAAFNIAKGAVKLFIGALKLVVGVVSAMVAGAVALFNQMKARVSAIFRAMGSVVKAVWNALRGAARAAWNAIKSVVSSAAQAAANRAKAVFNGLKGALTAIFNAIKGAAQSAWNAIKGIVTSVSHAIASAVKSAWNSAKSAVTSAVNAIKSAVSSGFNALKGIVSAAMSAVIAALRSAAGAALEAGKAVVEGFINGIKSLGSAAVSAAQDIANDVVGALKGALSIFSPSRVTHEIGVNVGQGLINGMLSTSKAVADAGTTLGRAAGDSLNDWGDRLVESMRGGLKGLPKTAKNAIGDLLKQLKQISPSVQDALADLINPKKFSKGLKLIAKDIGKLTDRLEINEKAIEKNQRRLQKKGITPEEKEVLKRNIAIAKDKAASLKDEIKSQVDKAKELRKELKQALKEVVQNSFTAAAEGITDVKGYVADLMETVNRIFAEAKSGFDGATIKSGDLKDSLVNGLPVEDWLKALTSEIGLDINSTIEEILKALQIGMSAAGGKTADLQTAGSISTQSAGATEHHYHLAQAPETGSAGDPRTVLASIELEMRRKGKAT